MATFLVERYWPGVTVEAARAVSASLAGRGPTVVQTIVTATDEVCMWYVEAASAGDVRAAFDAVAAPIDRISAAEGG